MTPHPAQPRKNHPVLIGYFELKQILTKVQETNNLLIELIDLLYGIHPDIEKGLQDILNKQRELK